MTQITVKEHLEHLPGDILLAVALNDNTPLRNKKAAVEVMVEHGYPQAKHRDLAPLLADVTADREARGEVLDVVEQAIEEPLRRGASYAGVTTQTLHVEEPQDNG